MLQNGQNCLVKQKMEEKLGLSILPVGMKGEKGQAGKHRDISLTFVNTNLKPKTCLRFPCVADYIVQKCPQWPIHMLSQNPSIPLPLKHQRPLHLLWPTENSRTETRWHSRLSWNATHFCHIVLDTHIIQPPCCKRAQAVHGKAKAERN